jgi:hypothetical protein
VSTARLFVEAVDTAYRLGWALAGWLLFFATVAAILILAAIATGAWGVRAVSQGTAAALAAVERSSAPEAPSTPPGAPETRTSRPGPSWARTEHEEAA